MLASRPYLCLKCTDRTTRALVASIVASCKDLLHRPFVAARRPSVCLHRPCAWRICAAAIAVTTVAAAVAAVTSSSDILRQRDSLCHRCSRQDVVTRMIVAEDSFVRGHSWTSAYHLYRPMASFYPTNSARQTPSTGDTAQVWLLYSACSTAMDLGTIR